MEFNRTWKLLFIIKLFAKALRKQFVNSNVCQKSVVLFQERPFVFECFEFFLEFVVSNHFCDLRDLEVLNLVFEGSLRVFYKYTYSRVVIAGRKRMIKLNHRWTWSGS